MRVAKIILGVLVTVVPLTAVAHGPLHDTIVALQEELEEKPGDPDLLLRLAELHRKHGDLDKARACAGKVTAEQRPQVHLVRARILEAAGDPKAALAAVRTYCDQQPSDPTGWFRQAALLAGLDRTGEAAASQARGLKAAGPSATAPQFLTAGRLWRQAGKPENALQVLAQACEAHPKHIQLAEARADLLDEFGRGEEAEAIHAVLRATYPRLAWRWASE